MSSPSHRPPRLDLHLEPSDSTAPRNYSRPIADTSRQNSSSDTPTSSSIRAVNTVSPAVEDQGHPLHDIALESPLPRSSSNHYQVPHQERSYQAAPSTGIDPYRESAFLSSDNGPQSQREPHLVPSPSIDTIRTQTQAVPTPTRTGFGQLDRIGTTNSETPLQPVDPAPPATAHQTYTSSMASDSQLQGKSHGAGANGNVNTTDFAMYPPPQRYTPVPLHAVGSEQETQPLKNYDGSAAGGTAGGRNKKPGRLSKMFGSKNDIRDSDHERKEERRNGEKTHRRLSSWDILQSKNGAQTRFAIDPNQESHASGHASGEQTPSRPGARSGASTPRVEWEGFGFNPATASVENLRYADGDVGKGKIARSYYYLLSKSIVTRWFLYIFPVLVLLWIPGIVWLAGVRHASVWSVHLLWWSIWLTVVWGGWWAALAAAMMLPAVFRHTFATIVPSLRQWVDIIENVERPAAFIGWAVAVWVSFTPLIINNFTGDQSSGSRTSLSTFVNLLFGLVLSSLVFGAEKLIIQLIAYRFHQDSYEDRIRTQKLTTRAIVTLYINSHDIPGRRDTMTDADMKKPIRDPRRAMKRALKGLKTAAQTTTTAIGNVATEMTGQSVLQTNSPYNRVNVALSSANKSRMLARRLYYSFRQPDKDHLTINDIARYFPDYDSALVAFAVFDRDGNGDATRDEMDMALLQLHREKLAIEGSLRDIDGAVKRLDVIFLVIVLLLVILVMSAMVTNKLTTLVTSTGTFVLGLSWLIGTTMQEILGACIFLFVKHPFDVGDRVDVDGQSYVVAGMQLMSTTLRRLDGTYTFIGNDILRSKYIYNIRRSGPIAETFTFEVDFTTDFKQLQELRDKMLVFLKSEGRDYMPIFDVIVDDLPSQAKLVLKADIMYKSNWQESALRVHRRNKWVCALKNAMADCRIFGPAGTGNPSPPAVDPIKYMQVPYEAPAEADPHAVAPESPPPDFAAATQGARQGAQLIDRETVVEDRLGDIYDDSEELGHSTALREPRSAEGRSGRAAVRQRAPQVSSAGEDIEMSTTSTAASAAHRR